GVTPAAPPSAGVPANAVAAASPVAATASITAHAGETDWRFDMRQDGKAMTADEFDAWMRARRARVATGKAGKPDPYGSAAPDAFAKPASPPRNVPAPAPETIAAAREADAAKAVPVPEPAPAAGDGVTLQVAAFG